MFYLATQSLGVFARVQLASLVIRARCSVCGKRNWRTVLMRFVHQPLYCSDACQLRDEFDTLPHVRKGEGILLDPTYEATQPKQEAELRDIGFRF